MHLLQTFQLLIVNVLAAVSYLMAMMPAAAVAAKEDLAELVCQVRYASETRMLHQSATPDPYTAATTDFDGRFRFRAVVQGSSGQIEHITLTMYELDSDSDASPVIIHQVRYQAPFNMNHEIPALTGWNHVYANYLGRELRYGCALGTVKS